MTTWHIVPTGISILQKYDDQQKRDNLLNKLDNPALRQILHDKYLPGPADLSAEREGLEAPNLDQDRIIFLASDTPDGLLAARFNALIWAANFEVASFGTVIPNEPIVVLTIQDLKPADAVKFDDGMTNLARFFRELERRVKHPEQVVVHLSGGFKATIPYLIKLAELVQSKFGQRPEPPELQAKIRWVGAAKPLPVPLQRVDLGHLWRELYGKAPQGERSLFGHGYLYDGTDRKQPTELGKVVKSFLDPPPPNPR
jgi:CRISPR-associated protein (Cas_APE2256)